MPLLWLHWNEPFSPIITPTPRRDTRSTCRPRCPGRQGVVGGKVRGRLTGGNLTLLCSTLGTPYAIEPKDKILVIEDVHEAPYRVDRSLSQLRLAGVLDAIVGVVAGDFSSSDPKDVEEFDRILA